MKTYLIRVSASLFICLLGLEAGRLGADANEFWEIRDPSPEQQCVLLGIEREIGAAQKAIQAYYKDLLDDPCSGAEGGDPTLIDCRFYHINKREVSIIPLTSERETTYGRRERWFIAEHGAIQWQKEKIASFRLTTRRSLIGHGNSSVKTIAAAAKVPEADPGSLDVEDCLKLPPEQRVTPDMPLDLIVREVFSSGRGGTYTFRFPTKQNMEIRKESRLIEGKRAEVDIAYVRDTQEKMEIDGATELVNVIYVREFGQRIEIAREYLRLLKLMLRRVDWNTRAANARRVAEIQRVMTRAAGQ